MPISINTNIISSPTEVIYLEYRPKDLPPVQEGWTRFVCLSDTHSRKFSVPPGDVLLHSGDLTGLGTVAGFKQTMDWLYSLPHKIKIIIAGNHDLPLDAEWYDQNFYRFHATQGKQPLKPIIDMLKGPKATSAGLVYLQNEQYEFRVKGRRSWTVYGSPWSPEFFNWAFNYERDNAEDLISKFPKTDILLTHGPPFEIFDLTKTDEHVGCEALAKRLPFLRPRLHVFGHIHEDHGAKVVTWSNTNESSQDPATSTREAERPAGQDAENQEKTVFVNAANWPMGSKARRDGVKVPFAGPGFQPVVVDLKD